MKSLFSWLLRGVDKSDGLRMGWYDSNIVRGGYNFGVDFKEDIKGVLDIVEQIVTTDSFDFENVHKFLFFTFSCSFGGVSMLSSLLCLL